MRYRVKAALLRRLNLRTWVKAALEQYGLQNARFTLLKEGVNQRKLFFYVESPTRGRFILRMYKPSRRSENLLPELLWLQALHDHELPVPEPVPAADGSLISEVSFEGASKPRRCTLLRWLPGSSKIATGMLSPEDLVLAGSCIARLHRNFERHGVPKGSVFPYVWDWEWVFGEAAPLWNEGRNVYSGSELEVFHATAERVRWDLQELGKGRNVFGVIHRDLHLNNFLFHKGEAYVIDFETCGWGYYLFDLAVTLSSLEGCVEDRAPMRTALLEGYQRERPLPEGYWRHLEAFMAMRIVQRVNLALSWQNPSRREWGPRILPGSVEGLKEFVTRKGEAGQMDFASPWWRRAFR